MGQGGQGGQGKGGQGGMAGMGGQGGQGKGDQGGQGGQGGKQQPPQDQNPVKKQIEDAEKAMKKAEEELDKANREGASENQDKAIKELEAAKKKLEELLRQLREEEIERLLQKLQDRCDEMLRLQVQVYDGTKETEVRVQKNEDKKPDRAQLQTIGKLAVTENEIVKMASTAIQMIEAEGSAEAFAVVFKQVRNDMVTVADRLRVNQDTGEFTQKIEEDIIASLKEMIEALKKAKQESQQRKSKPSDSPPQQQKPQDQQLVDLIAQLKLIRSMQVRVNGRTVDYSKFYPEAEQAPVPGTVQDPKKQKELETVHKELKNLADNQETIQKVITDIAKGKNK